MAADETSEKQSLSNRLLTEIRRGVKRWQEGRSNHIAPPSKFIETSRDENGASSVLTHIPRREIKREQTQRVRLPFIQPMHFRTNRIKAFGRLFIWLYMILYFFLGTFWDILLRRDSESHRAIRLRKIIEKVGGTFIKFGQQLSMRIDLLPWVYTVELSKMLDSVPPFPLEQAIEIIERSIGRPWQDIFAVFDPKPVGSASVANVYQAVLKNGDKVAVKVRRPGIGELFMADFKVFDWLLDLA